ncbi:MAG TPA: hypothetical protein DIW26_02130 [Ruminococcus sp.]|nr:hypothetical protein [Ruminococcus sp.]HCR73219.1 hypothetical protein [Ruminococcus sp.]
MLGGLLEKSECAQCRLCCAFDNYDIWETPVFTPELTEKILQIIPDINLVKRGNCYSFRIPKLHGDELFVCPLLDSSSGCILGDEKPFECRIWPFRIMKLNSQRVIAVASICEPVNSRPLRDIAAFLKNGLAEKIFAYADKYPEIIKEYDSTYPILLFERTL